MADKKISELVEITSPASGDIVPIVDIDANATKKITAANLATYVNASYPAETIRDTIGDMLTSNTETDITVTHDDGNDKINFVVSVAAANLPSAIDAAKIANGNISNAEFQSLDGMTGGTVQAQLNEKLPLAGGTMTGTLAMASQAITTSSTVDGRNLTTDGSKLDGIEASATADQTNAEIRTAVEAASDSNVFTDADHSKLNAIEASATADQTGAEIKSAYEGESDTNAFTDADHTKLDGIEASADVTDATNVTAAGALMDSECSNLAAVKGINQALTTSSSPSFTGVTAALTGNSSTATALATARDIALGGEVTGSASFDGSSNVTITSTIAANSVGINELALSDGSADQFIKTNGSGTISFASVTGATTINNAVANRLVSIASVTTDFDGEANLTFDGSTLGLTGNMTVSGTVDGADIAAMKTKLDAIESSATADQTNAEIRAAVEAASDSNVFADADHTKLNAIEASATADQSDAEIRTAVEAASDSNVFTDADHSKLNGVAASANNYVHPNHSGEVTSTADGATVIADNIVDEANLKVSNSPTNGYALTAQSGNTGGLTWAEIGLSDNSVDSDHYVDGSIDNAHLAADIIDGTKIADDVINSEHYVAASIDNEHLADDAVGIAELSATGTASSSTFLRGDNSWVTPTDTNTQIGGATGADFNDNVKLRFGTTDNDLEIYHDGSNSIIADTGTGGLQILASQFKVMNAAGDENQVIGTQDGDVELYHNNSKKLETASGGVSITGDMTASGNVIAYSDERLKSDIKTIDNALDKVSQMRGVSFIKDDKQSSGVIAQELEKIAPELVIDGEYKGVAYGNTVGYLIEAIKELKAEIEELKKDK